MAQENTLVEDKTGTVSFRITNLDFLCQFIYTSLAEKILLYLLSDFCMKMYIFDISNDD